MINRRLAATLAAIPLVAGLTLAAPPAQAQWRRGYGGYYHGYGYRGYGPGAIIGGAILGLGVGAALAAPYYYRPPVVYAPPPRPYYAPYPYAPVPYYAPY